MEQLECDVVECVCEGGWREAYRQTGNDVIHPVLPLSETAGSLEEHARPFGGAQIHPCRLTFLGQLAQSIHCTRNQNNLIRAEFKSELVNFGQDVLCSW
jgi:hypothetical protein